MAQQRKTWFVTGASRGLGLATVRAALAAGHNVVAAMRKPDEFPSDHSIPTERVMKVRLDVLDAEQIDAAVKQAISSFEQIDVLVNNAGYGQLGAFEEVSAAAIRKQFGTNLFGTFEITRAVLPVMRKHGSGHVINVSSIGGIVGYATASLYCSTKFAMAGWSESLSLELESFGINVTVVHPGQFRTDFLDGSSMLRGDLHVPEYREHSAEKAAALDAVNHLQAGDPAKFGEAMVKLAAMENPPARLGAGTDAIETFLGRAEALRENVEAFRSLMASTDIG
jgi:NAD(P)-dependent dehydrogenase (short-subunit alcohol dehydrogenase family)